MGETRSYLKSGLGLKVLAWVLVFNGVLALLATATQLYASFERQNVELHETINDVEGGFGEGLTGALWEFDFKQIELLLRGIEAGADIATVTLTAEDGRVWRLGEASKDELLKLERLDLVHDDPKRGAIALGVLELGLSRSAIWSDLYAQVGVLFLSNLVKTLLASILLLIIFTRLVSRHLTRIARHVDETDWMVRTPRLSLDRRSTEDSDDLDAIVDAVNGAKARVTSGIAETQGTVNMLQLVLDTSSSGIVGLDPHGVIVSINPAARHMLGGASQATPFAWPPEIRFLDIEDMTPLDASADPVRRALAGQALKGEIAIMSRNHLDKEPRYARLSSAPTLNAEPLAVHTVVILDDVSDHEKNRQRIERASRLDALGQLTGGIAHDFNNLLATIQYAVQLALKDETTEKSEKYLKTALNSVERGSRLTSRLLAFAKRQPGLAKSTSVTRIIEEFRALTKPVIEENITLEYVVDHPDLWVFCDVPQLENALLNLVLNSRDAVMRSGVGNKIVVKVRGVTEIDADTILRRETPHSYIATGMQAEHAADFKRDDGKVFRYVEFAVTDNGPGMSEEVKRRSIDPFFTTKETNSGTGLGLSMVYGFIQQSDGELRIYSEVDHGTTIRMLLPRGTSSGDREDPVDRMPVAMGGGQRILLVEDEADLIVIMGEILDSLGYAVLAARSGREALELVMQHDDIDLLLTDVVMPEGIGGFELARRLREMKPGVPVVYMSGYAGLSHTAMGDVVAPMIQKPCPPAELARVLNSALKDKDARI